MHVVLPWSASVAPLPGPQAQGQGPGESNTPKRFSPGLGSVVRARREQRAGVLANPPLEAAGEVFQWERAVVLRGPTGQEQDPAGTLPLASLAQTFLASVGTAPPRGRLRGLGPDMSGCLPRLIPAGAFPLGIGLG